MAVANRWLGSRLEVRAKLNARSMVCERAGNCALEEVVMAVKTRRDYFNLDLNIDPQHIVAASRMVSQITGFVVQPNKAVVGPTPLPMPAVFTRTACSRRATPTKSCALRMWAGATTRLCCSSAVAMRSSSACKSWGESGQRGIEINSAFARFKELADRKSDIFDEDILALVNDESVSAEKEQYGFVSLSQHSETRRDAARLCGFHRGW